RGKTRGRKRSPDSVTAIAAATASSGEPLQMELDFQPAAAINPALLKNRRPAIERLTLTSSREAENLRLEIVCDTGAGASIYRQSLGLPNGRNPISKGVNTITTNDIYFPVL